MDKDDLVTAHSAGYLSQDISTLLPLWAQIPTKERAQQLISKTITAPEKFWRSYGLAFCPGAALQPGAEVCRTVHLAWCHLIGKGMLEYGNQAEAAELVTRIMAAITQTLRKDGAFRQSYHAIPERLMNQTS
jgi:neutral trehalase